MEFVAIDVETANADMSSICQIGLAWYTAGLLSEEWKTYIDPEDEFDGINVSIHGIDEDTVKGAPILSDIADRLYGFLDNRIVVCHTHFDRVAIRQASDKYGIRHPDCTWLDSARVARRTWKEFSCAGYGLQNVCSTLGYKFKQHDALEDAKAAGHILLSAIKESGLDIEGWLKRTSQPIGLSSAEGIMRDGNPEGSLYGEVMVFTGALEMPRREAADMAAQVGCQVGENVTRQTTLLVVGDQDVRRLAGHERSSKHRKTEELIAKGFPIRIIRESDFKELIMLETAVVAK